MRLFYTILLTAFFVGSLAQAKQVTLTDTQGRELVCKLLNKNDSSALVSIDKGKKFVIPFSEINQESIQLVNASEYSVVNLLNEIKADGAFKSSIEMANPTYRYYYDYQVCSNRPMTSEEERKKKQENIKSLDDLVIKYGKVSEGLINTELSLSVYEFIQAVADPKHKNAAGRIIQGCFTFGNSTTTDLSNNVLRIYEISKKIPDHNLSKEITFFMAELLEERNQKRINRFGAGHTHYYVSRQLSDLAKKLLWRIDSTEDMYSF